MEELSWKPISLEDTDIIFESIEGNVAEYFYNFKNRDEVQTWVKNAVKAHNEGEKLEFMIFDNNEFIGMVSPCYLTNKKVEVGIWIATHKQGKGYGKRVLGELLERLQEEGVKEVLYETEMKNESSVRLAISLGFVLTRETSEMLSFIKWIN